ncbi:MAG: hypothetical protein IJ215_01560 [Clostridia bacterium]|nr:hypothetical protein [Clostridia bacterium]
MKKIFIILTQSGTGISKILKFVTKDKYNHSSICLNDDFQTFYSFGRKNPYFILPGGFIIENAFTNVFARFSSIPCMILEKEVSEEQYTKIQQIIHEFSINKNNYSYAVLTLFFADTKLSFTNKNKFFCSQFVAKILNDINISTPKLPEHTHPLDFTQIDGIKKIYEGDLKEFCKEN